MTPYTAYQGNVIGQPDDDIEIIAASLDEAVAEAQEWADESDWPEGQYTAVLWIEDDGGNVVHAEDVEIDT